LARFRYDVAVQLPTLGFAKNLRVVGVPSLLAGFDGIACFSFVNRFSYGNFGNSGMSAWNLDRSLRRWAGERNQMKRPSLLAEAKS
jgi:hypothetical protein